MGKGRCPGLLPLVLLVSGSPAAAGPATPVKVVPEWHSVAPGVWKATVGTPESFTLLSAAGVAPKRDALGEMPAVAFPLDAEAIEARTLNGKVALRFPLAGDEEIYGLGVDFRTMRRTGSVFQLHVDHWGGRTGRTHAPVPLYVSTRGYAVLIDSARYVTVNVGAGVRLASRDKPPVVDRTTEPRRWSAMPRSDSVEALVPAEGVEVLVFGGPTPLDAVQIGRASCRERV